MRTKTGHIEIELDNNRMTTQRAEKVPKRNEHALIHVHENAVFGFLMGTNDITA